MGLSPGNKDAGTSGQQLPATLRLVAASYRLLGPDWPWIAAVLLVAILAAWPAISQPGLLNTRGGGDSPFLLQRLHQLTAALANGHFPARWMPDANYGYGYPFYNFYAPLSIYVAAAFRFLDFSFVRAIHLAQLAGFVVAGLGMFHLGWRWLGSRWAGLLAAVAYTLAPFHMVNVYVRGDSLAEFWAMAFYPLILLAADRLMDAIAGDRHEFPHNKREVATSGRPLLGVGRRAARDIALFALAYAGLILSHNISALIFSPFLLFYMVIRLATANYRPWKDPDRPRIKEEGRPAMDGQSPVIRGLWLAAGGLLLAFALAAWFFVPALAEQGLAQLGPITEGYFHYSNHFRGRDLIQGNLLFNYNPDGGVAFRLGLVQVGLAGIGAALWLTMSRGEREKGRRGDDGQKASSMFTHQSSFVIVSALIAVFMVTPLSRPLWDYLPLLEFTQFPWRFLSVASFFLALLAGGVVLATDRPAARAAIALTGSLVLLAASLLGLRTDHLILTDADVTAERLAQYEWFTGNIGTTVSAEYLTPETTPRPWASTWINTAERDRVMATAGQLTAKLVDKRATQQTWRVVAGDGGAEALFPTMYWPGWRATVDGRAAELRPYPASGLMALYLPAGEHTVSLQLGRTPVRLAAELVSVAAIVVAGALLFSRRRAGDRQPPAADSQVRDNHEEGTIPPHPPAPLLPRLLRGLVFVACGLLLSAFLWRGDPEDLPAGDLTWDFAQMGYLHHSPGGVGFTSDARLFGYGYSAEEIAAGGTLTVTLSIDKGDSTTAELALVTPATARPTAGGMAEPPVLVRQAVDLNGESAVFTVSIAGDAPAGLYVPRLILDGARPLAPSGVARGDLFLRPVRIMAADGQQTTGNGMAVSGEEWSFEVCDPPADTGSCRDPLPPVELVTANILARDASTLDGRFAWRAYQAVGGRYQLSWRLQNGDGLVLSQLDTQPGYGFNPTDGWAARALVHDWLALRLPEALAGPPPYPLVILLYDAGTGEPLLFRRVGAVMAQDGHLSARPVEPVFTLPEGMTPFQVVFGESGRDYIRLRDTNIEQTGDELAVTFYWESLGDIPADYTRFVHLIDASGAVVAQADSHPAGNSYPTGQWAGGEIITDTVRFDPATLPAGDYRVATGFYRPVEGLPRLAAASDGEALAGSQLILSETIVVPAR